ncbi:MAG TPA: alpha/beta fold hydrolase [Smithellaceae bacterium]|nr:alpha/beta fold hydrolase [Smithellaceae bacterium]
MSASSPPAPPGPATNLLLAEELKLFLQDYEKNYKAGESKPPEVGMPFLLIAPASDTGVLLIHGLMAAPAEVREWAEFLHARGLTVYAPRLSGHGTSSGDLSTRNANDWLSSVDRGHALLKTCCAKILVAGFSTGAGLALQSAILKPRDFEAVIAVSAPLRFKSFSSRFAELLHGFNLLCANLGMDRLAVKFMKNDADNPHINYLLCPVSSFVQVKKLMRSVGRRLADIQIPALILQGRQDPKVAPKSGPAIYERLGAHQKRFAWIEFNRHGIVLGPIAREVFKEVESFLGACRLIDSPKQRNARIGQAQK